VNRRKDGSLWDAESVIAPVFNAKGDLQNYLCTARDITLERQLQGFLEQSQRLETIGTLTSGIAHDFNNILMPVLGHTELGLERPLGDPGLKHDLEVIRASAHRARDLVRQILTFSRKGEGELTTVEIQSLLSESLKLLRATVPTSIAFEVELAAQGKFVLGDPTKLHQVILNLCTNAGQAMRGQAGRLTVRLRPEHCSATPCAMNILLKEGEYVCLEVTDTGKGIPPEYLDKIFLPFFTTKPPREGTGLGLSVTHGIVSAMKGGIQVASQPGVGTSFKVFLPVAPVGPVLPSEAEEGTLQGHGHILLVDDEAPLLEMLHASLAGMGFRVSSFCDPELALSAFLTDPAAFQAVLTDHTMPTMSGLQLAEAIWTVQPLLPVILLTGDPELGKTWEVIRHAGFRTCLAKPISPRGIAKALLEAMGAHSEQSQSI
jgi:signal transduction histidine kinase/ActR/RegA family two-component response regulator